MPTGGLIGDFQNIFTINEIEAWNMF